MAEVTEYLRQNEAAFDMAIKNNLIGYLTPYGVEVDPEKVDIKTLHKLIAIVTGVDLMGIKLCFAGCSRCKPTN